MTITLHLLYSTCGREQVKLTLFWTVLWYSVAIKVGEEREYRLLAQYSSWPKLLCIISFFLNVEQQQQHQQQQEKSSWGETNWGKAVSLKTNWGKAVSLVSYIKPVWRKLASCANLNLIKAKNVPDFSSRPCTRNFGSWLECSILN